MTRRDILLPWALLLLALVVLFHRLLAGDVLFWGLPSLQFYPWRHYAFEQLAGGHLPAWNPYLGAGAPLLANYQTALFYPPNLLLLLLPDPYAMSVIALLHVIWAGIGMWLFTGALDLPAFGRGISTLAYALCGYLIARVGSFPTADAGAWLPWLFWLAHRVLTGHRLSDMGWLALAFGMQLLAGHAQTAWYSAVGIGLYVLWQALWNLRVHPARQPIIVLSMAGLGLILGAGIAAVQLVPTAEYLMESHRSSGLDYDTLANLSYHPLRLTTLFSPNFYGTPVDGSYLTSGKGAFFEDAAYIGFIPVISALAAIWGWLRLRRRTDEPRGAAFASIPFWAGLALLALVLGMGKNTPLFRLLYNYVPTFDAFREPVRWLILADFGLAVLAGIGVQHWGRGKRVVFWSRLSAAGGGAMVVMALAYLTFAQPENDTLEVLSWGMIVWGCWVAAAALLTLIRPNEATGTRPSVWQVTVLVFVTIDLTWAGSGLNPTITRDYYDAVEVQRPSGRIYWFEDYRHDVTFGSGDKTEDKIAGFFNLSDYRIAGEQWRALRTSLLPNINMLDRVPSLNNNDPLLPEYHGQYIDLIEDLGTDSVKLLRAANVTEVYGETLPPLTPLFELSAPEDVPAWLVQEAQWLDSDNAITGALRDPAWDPAQTVILAGKPPADLSAIPTAGGSVTLLDNQPGDLRYRIDSDGAAYLVIGQTWYPGWSVTVNGEDAILVRANLAFQAVAVPDGTSEVRLRYRVNHWRTGVIITLLAALVTVGLIGWRTIRPRQNRS
jgi:hypothetical protein